MKNNPATQRVYNRRYLARPGVKERIRDHQLRRVYGITVAQFEDTWQAQGGTCKLCDRLLKRGRYGAQVDHDHITGKFRGLLCVTCNTALGKVERWGLLRLRDYLA